MCENAEQAGGTIAYFDGLGERFLTWNAIGDRLCIRELSLSKDIPNSVVELNFSNARVLSCSLFHEPNELFNLTCTSDGVYQEIYSPFHQVHVIYSILIFRVRFLAKNVRILRDFTPSRLYHQAR